MLNITTKLFLSTINICLGTVQGIGIYSYLQPVAEDQEQTVRVTVSVMLIIIIIMLIVQNSSTTDDIVYADLGPNTAARNAHQNNLTLLDDDCVQYEEIRHAAGPYVHDHEPSTADNKFGNHIIIIIILACVHGNDLNAIMIFIKWTRPL